MVISQSVYWLMIDYALMLSGAVSVPLFTNISTKNLRFQIKDADIHTAFTQTDEQTKIILEANSTIECIDVDAHYNLISQIIDTGIKYKFDAKTDTALSIYL